MTKVFPWVLLLAPGFCVPGSWAADDSPNIDVDYHRLATGYAHLVSFSAEPEIASGRYSIDSEDPGTEDSILDATKLPLYKEFSSDDHEWSWYLQGALSYYSLEQEVNFFLEPELHGSTEFNWYGYGGMVESGLIFPLSNGFSWTAGLGFGVSRLENDADFSNQKLKDLLDPLLGGSVYDWSTNVSTTRGDLGLTYQQKHGNYDLKGKAHITYTHIDSYSESRGFGGFSGDAGTVTLKLDVRHPLGVELRKYPVYIIGHVGNTNFIGSNRGELGFNSFSELGLSFGIEKWTLGALGIIGDGVTGWNIIFNYDY